MDLYYKEYGAGPPLLILHGLLGAGGNWHTLSSKVFGEAFHVFAVDQRNHGRSPHHDVHDYPSMAADLKEFMDAHDLATARLLGHSMGGKTAMHFALAYPHRVEKLIVVDMAPRAYPPRHDELIDALRALDLPTYGTRQEIDEALAARVPNFGVRQFLLKNLAYDKEGGGYTWQMNLNAIHAAYADVNRGLEAFFEEETFEGPVLFVRGGKSDYVTDEDAEEARRWFPHAETVTIPGAGHWVHAEAPDAFAEAVMDFLQ